MRFLKNKRLIAGVVVVLAIVAMAMWPESIEVNAASVDRGPLQVTVDEDGETRVRDKFVVSAPVAGRLQRRCSTRAHAASSRPLRKRRVRQWVKPARSSNERPPNWPARRRRCSGSRN
jgi:hypothetical protein